MGLFGKKKPEIVEDDDYIAPQELELGSTSPVDWEVSHRRVVYLLRGSLSVNFMLSAVICILAAVLFALFPLKEIQLGLVHFGSSDNKLAWIEPVREDVEGLDLFIENHSKQFIRLTQTIDGMTESERFQKAIWMASSRVWGAFQKERIDSNAIQDVINSGGSRSIKFHVAQKIESLQPGLSKYRVEFTQIDQRKGEIVKETVIEAILGIQLIKNEVKVSKRYLNPLGVTVVAFSMRIKDEDHTK